MILDTLIFKTEIKIGNITARHHTSKVDMLLNDYHSSLLAGHTEVMECYMTISQGFYCPSLAHHIRAYLPNV